MSEASRYERFRALHERDGAFIIPNPWDAGTARILAGLGFEALATTSAGLAFSLGIPDSAVSREQTLANCRDIVAATDLPVSADLKRGFGDSPESAAETVHAAAEAGLAGCSIEDFTERADDPIYERRLAVDRIAAATRSAIWRRRRKASARAARSPISGRPAQARCARRPAPSWRCATGSPGRSPSGPRCWPASATTSARR